MCYVSIFWIFYDKIFYKRRKGKQRLCNVVNFWRRSKLGLEMDYKTHLKDRRRDDCSTVSFRKVGHSYFKFCKESLAAKKSGRSDLVLGK